MHVQKRSFILKFSPLIVCAVLALPHTLAQSTSTPTPPHPVITSDNIPQLRPITTIDFADAPADLEIDTGWFTLSPDGSRIAVVRRDGGLVIYNAETQQIEDTFAFMGENEQPATVLDAMFSVTGDEIATIHTDGEAFFAAVHVVNGTTTRIPLSSGDGIPVRVWLDALKPYLWIETSPISGGIDYSVLRLPLAGAEDSTVLRLPSAPERDPDLYVRIGRIPAPLAITTTADGIVKVWDLQTASAIYTLQLDQLPVFGRVNETTGAQLAWRDPQSQTLNLLDFASGENQVIAPLDGSYIQAMTLTPSADVILAVHIGDDPVVVAWDVKTSERLALGTYRACNRVPDMVQLSRDGSALVIGCDTGLEVWRVAALP